MQKKFLEERKQAVPKVQTDVERMKESLFAPAALPPDAGATKPSAPIPPPPIPPKLPQPPSEQMSQPTPSKPSYSDKKDPYREPIE